MNKSLTYFQRIFIVTSSIVVWFFAFLIFKPWIVKFYSPLFSSLGDGPKLFWRHALIYSTPTAIICFVWYLVLEKMGLLPKVKISLNKGEIKHGVLYGLAITCITLAIAPILKLNYSFHFNSWSVAGNFFSNACEELIFRGLLFFSLYIATGSRWFGIIVSGIIFGLTHEQYPWLIKGYISIIGGTLSYLASQNNNLIAPIVAHDISDWILDIFL